MQTSKTRRIQVSLPKMHERQRQVLSAYLSGKWRYFILRWGRRSGKTKLASMIAFGEALQGKKVFWLVPEYKYSNTAWRDLKALVRRLTERVPGLIQSNEQDRIMTFPRDGWVQVLSVKNPDSVRSEGVHLAVIDEAALIRRWEEVWQALRPALTDYRGRVIFISTPKGKNFFYQLWKDHEGDPDWYLSHMRSEENPFLPPGEIEEARRTYPPLFFRQEFEAEFVDVEGAFFKREWLRFVDAPPPEDTFTVLVRGWDIAITPDEGDYTVGAKVGVDREGVLWVLDLVRGRWDWPTVVRAIRETALRDGPQVSQAIEAVGVQKGIWQTLMREPALAGLALYPVYPRGDKMARALPLASRAQAGQFVILQRPWTRELVDELLSFPLGEHDDQVDALTTALQMLAEGQVTTIRGIW